MFYLEPKISISEKEFKNKHGEDVFNQIISRARSVYGNSCCGCGLSPEGAFLNEKEVLLDVHVIQENESEPLESEVIVLCRACHATQHIDKSIEAGFVDMCNSSLSQKDLIIKSRDRDILFHENHGNIKYLKLSGQEYIERLKNNTLGPNMIKFVFKDTFNFGA